MKHPRDLTGLKFSRWTVIRGPIRRPRKMGWSDLMLWLCRCDCGTEREIARSHLLAASPIKSCGCAHREMLIERNFRHGKSKTRIHHTWQSMIGRCSNENNTAYKNYGGRGIRVCDRWQTFENFYEDMFPSYSDDLTIERINNDGNYELGNCEWIPWADQAKNRRSCRIINTPWGPMNIAEAARRAGIKAITLRQRIDIYNFDEKDWFKPAWEVPRKSRLPKLA